MSDYFEQKLFKMAQKEIFIPSRSLDIKIETVLENLPRKKKVKKFSIKTALVAAVILTFSISTTAFAAVNLLQQRLESINKEKLEKYFIDIQKSVSGSDHKNREYTKEENSRYEKLKESYESGMQFPEDELTLINDSSEYKGKGISFHPKTSTFFLPDKELTDEQILQIIDFYCKRNYSLDKVNAMIASGEMKAPVKENEVISPTNNTILNSDALWNPTQELIIPYLGDLEINLIQAGINEIFLAGFNGIHKMQIGSGDSQLFFNEFGDYDIKIDSMEQDKDGILYVGIRKYDMQQNPVSLEIWSIDTKGAVLDKLDVTEYVQAVSEPEMSINIIRAIAIDSQGYLYLRTSSSVLAVVIDRKGKLISYVKDDNHTTHSASDIGIGKDGRAYTFVYNNNGEEAGIALIDPINGKLEEIYMDIVPSFPLDVIAPGTDTDFMFWGYEGIFTYNLGDNEAKLILPPYEAPCAWEGSDFTALPDGRMLFAACTQIREVTGTNGKTQFRHVPEATTFYYLVTTNK